MNIFSDSQMESLSANPKRLQAACMNGTVADVRKVLSEGTDSLLDVVMEDEMFAIHYAIQGNIVEIVKFLVQEKNGKAQLFINFSKCHFHYLL